MSDFKARLVEQMRWTFEGVFAHSVDHRDTFDAAVGMCVEHGITDPDAILAQLQDAYEGHIIPEYLPTRAQIVETQAAHRMRTGIGRSSYLKKPNT